MTGRTIGPYEIHGRLGEGGMGVVYRAVDTRLGRQVAVKVLPPDASGDAERRRRFIHEARAASALNHPHIVTIYEADEHDGIAFIAMELVPGRPLDRLLAEGALPARRALALADQIAAALEAAHAAGLVHRDIKPANIIVSADDHVKVLDFGLAKLVDHAPADDTRTAVGTRVGVVLGTVAYMSPEQAQGQPVDARSDLFSLGAVLYEMLAGRRPFAAGSDAGLLSAILRDSPARLDTIDRTVPAAVASIVARALEKDPGRRYPSAAALRADLTSARTVLVGRDAAWRKPTVLIPAAAVLIAVAAWGAWQTVQTRRERWARGEAITEIERLYHSGRTMQAVRLAGDAERYAPDAIAQVRAAWMPFMLVTEPADATIEARNYHDSEGPWERLGASPLEGVMLPYGYYRVRITKAGYRPIEIGAGLGRAPVVLTPDTDTRPGMVFVPGGRFATGVAPPVTLPDYWIDQFEVTNAEYKKFVDAGGYRTQKYWTPFTDGGRTLSFEDAMARFRDATGQPGPATWELGSYTEGQDDFPVGGVSWFEAMAYAAFAGKELPTLYHWFKAAGTTEIQSDILQASNFDGAAPARVGERGGVGPWGTLDMAGNIKEWTQNEATGRGRRYILGGGWNEPSYRFTEPDAQNPWDRAPTYGMRLSRSLGAAEAAAGPVGRVAPDPMSVVPESPEAVEGYRRSFYEYDRTPLDARVDAIDEVSSSVWRKETVSFAAAYGRERVPAYLFVPKQIKPPYQIVLLFPTAYARQVPTSRALDLGTFEFLMKSGRAVLYPVYQGTFERRDNVPPGPVGLRDMNVQWAKDVFRAVDYLATRDDIDLTKLAYYSLSMGAYFGPIPIALEPRFKVAVFASGGLRYGFPAEVHPANFAPLVRIPVLLVNGKNDFSVSAAEQQRFHDLIGTPPALKRRRQLEGGHVPQDIRDLFRETLLWLDQHLGPAR